MVPQSHGWFWQSSNPRPFVLLFNYPTTKASNLLKVFIPVSDNISFTIRMPWLDCASWILQTCSWANLHAWHFAIESSPEELSHAQRTLEVKFSRTEVEFSARPSDPSLRMSSSVHVAAVGRKEGSDHPLLQRTIQQSWRRENKLYFLKGALKSV